MKGHTVPNEVRPTKIICLINKYIDNTTESAQIEKELPGTFWELLHIFFGHSAQSGERLKVSH